MSDARHGFAPHVGQSPAESRGRLAPSPSREVNSWESARHAGPPLCVGHLTARGQPHHGDTCAPELPLEERPHIPTEPQNMLVESPAPRRGGWPNGAFAHGRRERFALPQGAAHVAPHDRSQAPERRKIEPHDELGAFEALGDRARVVAVDDPPIPTRELPNSFAEDLRRGPRPAWSPVDVVEVHEGEPRLGGDLLREVRFTAPT